jgi:hypothetical protein
MVLGHITRRPRRHYSNSTPPHWAAWLVGAVIAGSVVALFFVVAGLLGGCSPTVLARLDPASPGAVDPSCDYVQDSACLFREVPASTAPPPYREFVIDEAFDPEEQTRILTAIARWNRAAPWLHLRATPAEEAYAFGTGPYAVQVLARHSLEDTACEHGERALGCWEPPARIELAADDLTRLGGWESVPGHEIGHMLGLHDVDSGHSMMRSRIADQALAPTDEDVRALRAMGGLP